MTQPSAGGIHPTGKARKRAPKKPPSELSTAQVVKQQVEVTPAGTVDVVNAKVGPLNIVDKLKAYYHTLITVLAAIIVILNQVAAVAHWIPGYGTAMGGYISAAIVFVAALVNLLKSNETWVQKL